MPKTVSTFVFRNNVLTKTTLRGNSITGASQPIVSAKVAQFCDREIKSADIDTAEVKTSET